MQRKIYLTALAVSTALLLGASSAFAFFDFQKLARMEARISLQTAVDTQIDYGGYLKTNKPPLAGVLDFIVSQNGVPPGEYDLVIDPTRWGTDRGVLITREDLILKPKPLPEKIVLGRKVRIYPFGLSAQYWEEWNNTFNAGFKFSSLHPLSQGQKAANPKTIAVTVNLGSYSNYFTPWVIQPGVVMVASKDFDSLLGVMADNVRLRNTDGRWNAYALPPSNRYNPTGVDGVPIRQKPKPVTTPPGG